MAEQPAPRATKDNHFAYASDMVGKGITVRGTCSSPRARHSKERTIVEPVPSSVRARSTSACGADNGTRIILERRLAVGPSLDDVHDHAGNGEMVFAPLCSIDRAAYGARRIEARPSASRFGGFSPLIEQPDSRLCLLEGFELSDARRVVCEVLRRRCEPEATTAGCSGG